MGSTAELYFGMDQQKAAVSRQSGLTLIGRPARNPFGRVSEVLEAGRGLIKDADETDQASHTEADTFDEAINRVLGATNVDQFEADLDEMVDGPGFVETPQAPVTLPSYGNLDPSGHLAHQIAPDTFTGSFNGPATSNTQSMRPNYPVPTSERIPPLITSNNTFDQDPYHLPAYGSLPNFSTAYAPYGGILETSPLYQPMRSTSYAPDFQIQTPSSQSGERSEGTHGFGAAQNGRRYSSSILASMLSLAPASRVNTQSPVPQTPSTTQASPTAVAPGAINCSEGRIALAGNGYGDDLQGRPPIGTFPPPHIEIGALEILSFCPRWLHHPDVILRLFKAGWKRTDIAKAQLHAINRLNYDSMKTVTNRVQKQLGVAGRLKLGMSKEAKWSNEMHLQSIPDYDDLTADAWKTRHDIDSSMAEVTFEDYKLADIAASVVRFPHGLDRLAFTKCVEYGSIHPQLNLTTADCKQIIYEQGFAAPNPLGKNHDSEALQRFSAAVPTPDESRRAKQARQATAAKTRSKMASARSRRRRS